MEQKLNLTLKKEGLDKKDFVTDQEVRWCPGCGDYAILASMQKVLPELNIPKENMVFVSGIGCASRFPYYVDTYGFHTIHGRAPTIATGLKLMRPELSVWVVTGDGDALSIGANHLLHIMRRNIDVTILLFNNRIYGLTKGQTSPTSKQGKVTKSTPFGAEDSPLNPIVTALAANCSFVARGIDVDSVRLQWLLKEASLHKGTSFVEIYQNCNVFNDGEFANISDRGVRSENTVTIEPGKPMLFGSKLDKAIVLRNGKPYIEQVDSNRENMALFDQFSSSVFDLAKMDYPEFPVAIGIFRREQRQVYAQPSTTPKAKTTQDIQSMLEQGSTWRI